MLRLAIEVVSLSPVEVPRRVTQVRVQWHSGAISDLQVPRPGRGDNRRTPTKALERIRQLAAEGEEDTKIAERLNSEGLSTGTGLSWTTWRVNNMRRHAQIERANPNYERCD